MKKKICMFCLTVCMMLSISMTVFAAEPVASVDGVGYDNLQSAIDAADGKTVTVLTTIDLTDTLTIQAGKTITLNLNGNIIRQTKAQTAGYQMILNSGNLTIQDTVGTGKISYTDSGNGGEYISDTIYNKGVLVIEGGTIENLSSATVASNGYPHAVDAYSGERDTSVTINDGTIYCAEYSAIRMFCVSATHKADLIINGGTIKGAVDMQNGTVAAALGSLTVNGGTFETTKNVNNIRFANWNGGATTYGITASITSGRFNGGISTAYVPAGSGFDSKIISGGTYSQDVSDYCVAGNKATQSSAGEWSITPSSEAVASVDGVGYTDLQSAIDVADGKTVTVLTTINLTDMLTIQAGKTITLDLNGNTIQQTKAQTAGYQMILNSGNLTIQDAVGTGKISYTDSGNGGNYISDTIYNKGVLVIEGGTIENLSSATVASNGFPHAVDTYSGERDASVTINDGTIYCAEYSAIRMFCVSATNKADLTINGGTIKGAVDMQNGTAAAALGSLTVNGGTFETTKNANNIRFANWNGGATTYGITASITAGRFNGGISTAYVPAGSGFDSKIISGGIFSNEVPEQYCAANYVPNRLADGTYGVHVHDSNVVIPGEAATCTAAGVTDGVNCSVCGETIVAQEAIPAKGGHVAFAIVGKKATCTEDGHTDYTKCYDCGIVLSEKKTIEATGHTVKEGKCTVCGTATTTQFVSPQTGDDNHMILWFAIMVAAVIGCTILVSVNNKRTETSK